MYRFTAAVFLLAAGALLHFARPTQAAPVINATAIADTLMKRMTYHGNDVYLSDFGSDLLEHTWFQVGDFKITSGQDPQARNHIGDVHTDSFHGPSFIFDCGRSGSGDVASWWSARVPPPTNNYNKNPGDLNFAFAGTMILTWHSGHQIRIDNFYLAQGHTSTSNDWWVGGPQCNNLGRNCQVRCTGVNKEGNPATVDLRRGKGCGGVFDWGSSPSNVEVANYQSPPA